MNDDDVPFQKFLRGGGGGIYRGGGMHIALSAIYCYVQPITSNCNVGGKLGGSFPCTPPR